MGLIVSCVAVNRYERQQAKYVNCLYAAAKRHITLPFLFMCLTDDATGFKEGIETIPPEPGPGGWWQKIALLKPGKLPKGERILNIDLDTLILANIDDLAAYDGPFAGLGCFRAHRQFASGIMAWEAGTVDFMWTEWAKRGYPLMGGADDVWMDHINPNAVRIQRRLPAGYIVSYKWHKCQDGPPEGARICVYQRRPKIHDCGSAWVAQHWTED